MAPGDGRSARGRSRVRHVGRWPNGQLKAAARRPAACSLYNWAFPASFHAFFGRLPIMSDSTLAKSFEPHTIEAQWGPEWEKRGYAAPTFDPDRKDFSIQ